MKAKHSRKQDWPRKVTFGRVSVSIYKRTMPNGKPGFLVASYATGKRKFDSYADEAFAIEAANKLARQLSEGDTKAALLTEDQAVEYVNAQRELQPTGVSLTTAVSRFVEAFNIAGDVVAACKFYSARHKRTTAKRVADVVAELLTKKEAHGASERYMQSLRHRLNRFAEDFQRDTCNITTAEIQAWLDSKKFGAQTYTNCRSVVHLFFKFAVARGYAADNPVAGVERVKVRNGDAEIFTPVEIARLLAAVTPEFLPSLAIGAFAGLRSAEIERLTWDEIHLAERFIVVGASKAKTAGRRIVPITDNLAEWLAPYAGREGNVWTGGHDEFYEAQQDTAAATAVEADAEKGIKAQPPVKWKANALRHSYASYRFALTNDAGRVAGECGNSAGVIHKHYRELVRPVDAQRWFNVKPESPDNIVTLAATANA